MTPDQYLQGLYERLAADDCSPQQENGPTPMLIGHRSDFKIQWMATRMHLFTIAAPVPEITVSILDQFTEFAMDSAIQRKSGLVRGFQTGIAVFPALVSDRVDPAALAHAARGQKIRFACMGRPTVVDTANNLVGAYRGHPLIGFVYGSYLRTKNVQYFPPPQ